jgi:Bacterial TSP3 repeat
MRATSISTAALAVAVSGGIVLSGASAASARPDSAPMPPASGHAQVIAQGVVSFTAGEHHWRLVTNDVGTAPASIDLSSPTFLVAASTALDTGPVRITEPDGLGWLLADGEATFRPAGSAVGIDPTPGALVYEIAIDEGGGDDAFDPANGPRDVDLVRDVLATGESITVRSEVSALIVVTAGTATAADGSEIPTGGIRAIVDETTLTNEAGAPAVVLAVIIGSPVDAATDTTSAPGGEGPTPTQPPAAPPTTIDPTLETDGDGLTDVEEIDIYGTDPNNYDTDGDTVSDYLEAKNGYSDPFNPDSDGDGYDDSEQFDGYDPLDPTSYPGAPSQTTLPPPPPPSSAP